MQAFRYEARNQDGASVRGEIEAADRQRALRLLGERGLFPTTLMGVDKPAAALRVVSDEPAASAPVVAEENGSAAAPRQTPERSSRPSPAVEPSSSERPDRASRSAPAGGRIRRKDITFFTREMATLLEAEIPIPRALAGLAEEEENDALRAIIDELAVGVRQGRSLSESLAAYPKHFPTLYTSMVEVGEESGRLASVLADLADLLEREDEIRGEVLGAVAYPAFVLLMGIVTTFVLLAFVLPRLFGMLTDMMDSLPMPTRVLLGVSEFFRSWWFVLLVAVAASLIALRWYYRTAEGGLRVDALKLRAPVFGPVFRATALGRFARTLGTLLDSGVSLLPALEIVRNTVGNRQVSQHIAEVTEETRRGESLAAPLRRTGLFPATMVQMISVGEETGCLDTMLLKVAAIQERLVRGRSKTLISLLAPVLILVVGALVGFIVIALLLPIFRMSQALR